MGFAKKIVVSALILLSLFLSAFPLQGRLFTDVSPASPLKASSVSLVVTDDGSGDATDGLIDVPAYVPGSGETPTLTVLFTITGTGEGTRAYYGDDPWEDWRNITLSGDVLYPLSPSTICHLVMGDWLALVTPTQTGGLVTLSIDWPGNGSANRTLLTINGTCVRPSITTFIYTNDTTVTATVTDADGEPLKYAYVYAYRATDHVEFFETIGDNTNGNGRNGEYSFLLNASNQGAQPQDIIIAANRVPGYWGYARLQPTIPPTSFMLIRGRLTNLTITNTTISFTAVKIHTLTFSPLTTSLYTSGERFTITQTLIGVTTNHFILGVYRASIIP